MRPLPNLGDCAIPTALAKWMLLYDVLPTDSVDMKIILNPDMFAIDCQTPFYLGTDGNVGDYEYDLFTIMLRSLVAGCGFHSGLKKCGEDANFVPQLSMMIEVPDGSKHLTIYDNFLQRTDYTYLRDVLYDDENINEDLTIKGFFTNQSVSWDGYYPIYNGLQYGIYGYDTETLNVFDLQQGNNGAELMSFYMGYGSSYHRVDGNTASLLYNLGWNYNIPVGLIGEPLAAPRLDVQQGANTLRTLEIETDNDVYSRVQVVLRAEEGDYTLYDDYVSGGVTQVSYNDEDLPNLRWLRNASNHNIKAVVKLDDEVNHVTNSSNMELICRPNKPDLQIDTLTDVNGNLMAHATFYSRGATSYQISCQTIVGDDVQQALLDSSHMDYSFVSPITNGVTYKFTVDATNNYGTQNTSYYVVAPTAVLSIQTSVQGNLVYYSISQQGRIIYGGTSDKREIEISSINFYDLTGGLELSYSGGPHPVDISSLSSGFHIMRVTAASGQVLSGRIRKL